MKVLMAAAGMFFVVAIAQAQEAPAASAGAPPSECPAIPPDPAMPNAATASMTQMGAASDALGAWREQVRAVHECRRLQFNAVVERMNAVSAAWSTQLDAFCARRDIRCEDREPAQ